MTAPCTLSTVLAGDIERQDVHCAHGVSAAGCNGHACRGA